MGKDNKKTRKGKEVTQIMPINYKVSVTAMIIATWQHIQFANLLKEIPPSWVILNKDISENNSCKVQNAHWDHKQCCVLYENFTKTVQEALIFISSDHTHDAAAVMKFTSIANHHLTMTRGINIEWEIQLTDIQHSANKKSVFGYLVWHSRLWFPDRTPFYGSRHLRFCFILYEMLNPE